MKLELCKPFKQLDFKLFSLSRTRLRNGWELILFGWVWVLWTSDQYNEL